MANTVFRMEKYQLKIYDNIKSDDIITPILANVEKYLNSYDCDSKIFESLIFCFKNDSFDTEIEF
ncbi:hypothetical protein RCH18_000077 [Flavobacterium sp. PL11]|jgi:hypothetical protein|nr:hypothetical protein [Flavobacterium sp. PL11]